MGEMERCDEPACTTRELAGDKNRSKQEQTVRYESNRSKTDQSTISGKNIFTALTSKSGDCGQG